MNQPHKRIVLYSDILNTNYACLGCINCIDCDHDKLYSAS